MRRNTSAQKAPSSTTSMYTEEETQGAGVRHPPAHLHAWEEVLALKPGSSFSLQTRSMCLHQGVRSVNTHVSIHGNKTELPLAVPDARMWHHVKRRARLITEARLTYYIQFKTDTLEFPHVSEQWEYLHSINILTYQTWFCGTNRISLSPDSK